MPRVTMKLTAKERKEGVDLRNFTITPIKDAGMRRRLGAAAIMTRTPGKPDRRQKTQRQDDKTKAKLAAQNKPKKEKVVPTTLIVTSDDVFELDEEIEEWEHATIDVSKVLRLDQRDEAIKSADASASGSNVDFVVYEVREIYRAKRGM